MNSFDAPSNPYHVGKAIKYFGERRCYWWPLGNGKIVVQFADAPLERHTMSRKEFERDFAQESQVKARSERLAQKLRELPPCQIWETANRKWLE